MNIKSTIALAAVTVTAACGAEPAGSAAPMVRAGNTIQIAEDVYVIPDQRVPLVPNVGIVVGTDGVLVVDTGMGPANAEVVLEEVRRITDLPILFLVCTHFHPEHNFGAQSFPESAVIVYSNAQRRELREKGEAYRALFIELFGDDVAGLLAPVEIVPPDVSFARKAEIDLGDLPVEFHHFGMAAHTRGDTVVYLPGHGVIFAGGLTPNRFFPIFPDQDSSVAGWIASLERLRAFDAAHIVPGHGEVAGTGLISDVRDYLLELQRAASTLQAEGVALGDAQERLTAEFERKYDDWDAPNWISKAVGIVYAEAGGEP